MTFYQKVIRVIGWVEVSIGILVTVLNILMGFLVMVGSYVDTSEIFDGSTAGIVFAIASFVIASGMSLLRGWLCFRAAKDRKKVMPILVLSMITVALMLLSFFVGGTESLTKTFGVVSIIKSVVTFLCAVQIQGGR